MNKSIDKRYERALLMKNNMDTDSLANKLVSISKEKILSTLLNIGEKTYSTWRKNLTTEKSNFAAYVGR